MFTECLKVCSIFKKTYKSIDRKNEKGKRVELFSVKKFLSIGTQFVKYYITDFDYLWFVVITIERKNEYYRFWLSLIYNRYRFIR